MSAKLNISSSVQAYTDSGAVSSNPLQRVFDWTRKLLGVEVTRPSSRQFIVDPGATISIFNGSRSTSIDGTTAFTATISPLSSSRYRFTNSAGTAPAFRTARTISHTGVALTLTALTNGALQISAVTLNTWVNLVVGDQVFIPGITTGDTAGPFNAANEGLWQVIGVAPVSGQAARLLTLKRLATRPQDSAPSSESVTTASAAQLIGFTAAGVQPNDNVEFASALWSEGVRKNFLVDRVTPSWFEIVSTETLPLDVGVLPTSTGLIFYTDAKRFLRIEADQEAAVQVNGDSTQLNRISPISPADPNQVGWQERWGTCWSLSVINRSSNQMTLNVFAAD